MKRLCKMVSLLLTLCLVLMAMSFAYAEDEVINANLPCTITLGNWPRIPP